MRIGYICHDQLPGSSTSTEQLINNVSRLVQRGFDIDIIAPTHQTDPRPTSERAPHIAEFYGLAPDAFNGPMRLVELPLPRWIGGNGRRGLLDIAAARYCARQGYDAIYVRDAFPLVTALATRMPVIFETYRTDFNRKSSLGPWRWYCYSKPNLKAILTHSDIARQSFLERDIPEDSILVAHNGYSPEVMAPRMTRQEARARLGLAEDGSHVVYTGHVTERKGLGMMFAAAERMPEVTFHIVGAMPGSEGEQWAHGMAESAGLRNVNIVQRVPPAEVPSWLYAADVLMIPPSSDPLTRFSNTVLPMKTFLYLAAGRPIVAGDLPDIAEVLVHDSNALLITPDDVDATVDAIRRSTEDTALIERLSEQAVSDSAGYTWEARSERIAGFIRERVLPH